MLNIIGINRRIQLKDSIAYQNALTKYGTSHISSGKLTGKTDTDYFYFLCPNCDDGGKNVMRILDYYLVSENEFPYKDLKPKGKTDFILAFELFCHKCKLHNIVKITSAGRQGGIL